MTNTLLGGWQLSGIGAWQTGTPFSAYNGIFGDNAGLGNGVASGTPAQANPMPTSSPIRTRTFRSLIPPPASVISSPIPMRLPTPSGLTLGDSGRDFLRNPGHWNIDMALFKHFKITESMGFEFRAEAFNIFNHVEYGPWAAIRAVPLAAPDFPPGPALLSPDPTSCRWAPRTAPASCNSAPSSCSERWRTGLLARHLTQKRLVIPSRPQARTARRGRVEEPAFLAVGTLRIRARLQPPHHDLKPLSTGRTPMRQ